MQFFVEKKASIVIHVKTNKEYGLLSDYCTARELHWIIIICIINTRSKNEYIAASEFVFYPWEHRINWWPSCELNCFQLQKAPQRWKNPFVYIFGYHNYTAIVTRATCKIPRLLHKVKISSVRKREGILTHYQFLDNKTQFYLHCINKFLALHKSVFYDAVKLLFEIQQILYHTFIFFRIKNNASSLFLKRKKKREKNKAGFKWVSKIQTQSDHNGQSEQSLSSLLTNENSK